MGHLKIGYLDHWLSGVFDWMGEFADWVIDDWIIGKYGSLGEGIID